MTRREMIGALFGYCNCVPCSGCPLNKFDESVCDFNEWSEDKLTVAYNVAYKNGDARIDGSHLNPAPHVKLPKEATESSSKSDMVNHPQHYTQGGIECIDALKAATVGKRGIEAVCVANIIKYLWRYEEKNGVEDVCKAKWYIERLLKELEESQHG